MPKPLKRKKRKEKGKRTAFARRKQAKEERLFAPSTSSKRGKGSRIYGEGEKKKGKTQAHLIEKGGRR